MKRWTDLRLWFRALLIPKAKRCVTCGGAGQVAAFLDGEYTGHKPCWFCDRTGAGQ